MEIGKQSIRLEEPVYVESWASVVGKKEGEGPLAVFFDEIETDDQLGQNTWEEAESMLQQKAARLAVKKAGCTPEDIRIIFAGGSAGAVHCLLVWNRRTGSAAVRTVRCVLHDGRGAESRSHHIVGRSRRAGAGGDIQPFCHGGEGIPFSARLRKSETAVGFLDGYGKPEPAC